jgi:hypothetical protein
VNRDLDGKQRRRHDAQAGELGHLLNFARRQLDLRDADAEWRRQRVLEIDLTISNLTRERERLQRGQD